MYPKKYENLIETYSQRYEVDKNLIFAIIKAESNFKEKAISKKKARGLMQLMDKTALDIAKKVDIEIKENEVEEKILDSDININLGTKYISLLIKKYENVPVALAAYNAGSGNVDKWIEKGTIKKDGTDIENIPYKETNNYVRKILRDYRIYNKIYN